MVRRYFRQFILTAVIAAAVAAQAIAGDAPQGIAPEGQSSPAPSARAHSTTPVKATAGHGSQTASQSAAATKQGAAIHTQAQLPRMVIVVTATRMATPLSEI